MSEDIPTAVWSGQFELFGVTLRCYVLSDGRRIINADDVAGLFEAMGRGGIDDADYSSAEDFARWIKGRSP